MSGQQLSIRDSILRQLECGVDNKPVYSDQDMGAFSRWHRQNLPPKYAWSDLDHFAWDYERHRIYVLLEHKELPPDQFEPFQPTDPPDPDSAQLSVYWYLSQQLGCPAFVLWFPNDIEQRPRFKADPIQRRDGVIDYRKDCRVEMSGKDEFANWLDSLMVEGGADD